MADNRASKEKRQRRNRAEREARAARRAHAGEATAIARGEAERAPKTSSSRAERRDATATGKSGTTGSKPTSTDRRAAARERMKARYPIPGQRAMFMGLIFTAVFIATTLFTEFPVPDTVPEADPRVETADSVDEPVDSALVEVAREVLGDDAPAREVRIYENARLFDEEEPVPAGLILILPTLICGVAYLVRNSEQRNLVWTMALFAMTGYFMFAQPYSLFALPSLVAVGIGAFQSRREAQAPRLAELRAQREARAAATARDKADDKAGGVVIDVDPVDED